MTAILADLERFEASTPAERLTLASSVAEFAGLEFRPSSELVGRKQMVAVDHAPTGIRFILVPGGRFAMGLTERDLERVRCSTDFDSGSILARIVAFEETCTPVHDVVVAPFLLASVLQGAVAQRLVRRICPACARSRIAEPAELRLLKKYAQRPKALSCGAGCEACAGTGFHGRMVISESFTMDRELEEAIARDEGTARISSLLGRSGKTTIARDGMAKAAAGATTISEIEREVAL